VPNRCPRQACAREILERQYSALSSPEKQNCGIRFQFCGAVAESGSRPASPEIMQCSRPRLKDRSSNEVFDTQQKRPRSLNEAWAFVFFRQLDAEFCFVQGCSANRFCSIPALFQQSEVRLARGVVGSANVDRPASVAVTSAPLIVGGRGYAGCTLRLIMLDPYITWSVEHETHAIRGEHFARKTPRIFHMPGLDFHKLFRF